jgi:catechol 2,3-dioxygenase-like lactoylglutathione lyase family enzyme
MNADDGDGPLVRGLPITRLPAQDLERARRFYAERLGLEPVDERPGGLLYQCGGGRFVVFRSSGAATGAFTQMCFEVADVDATVAELRSRGVLFEEFELLGLLGGGRPENGITEVEGNYAVTGARGSRGAWFRDSEGNLLGVESPVM